MKTQIPVFAALTCHCVTALRRIVLPASIGVALAVGGFTAKGATAAPPNLMTYQGYLVDANGNPLAPTAPANYPVVFRIYDAAQAGKLIWSEQQIVTVDKGNFSVLLGEGSQVGSEARPVLASVFGGSADAASASDRYIDITVTISGSPVLIAPRLRLVASPYALLAASANSLVQPNGTAVLTYAGGQVTVTGNLNATGTLNASGRISGDGSGLTGLTAAQVPGLDASKIASGTFDSARIPTTLTGNRFFTAGSVGIGTTTVGSRLHVKDDTLPTAIFESSHAAGTWLALGNSTVPSRFWQFIMTGSGNGGGTLILTTGPGANTTSGQILEFKPEGHIRWSSGAYLANDQGGSLELGNSLAPGTIPFIDFHYGKGSAQDYNVRLINDADGQLSLSGSLAVNGSILATGHLLDLGAGVAGREGNAGKIGYAAFTAGALDIVGAGTPSVPRKVKIWAEGGAIFNGSATDGIRIESGDRFTKIYRNGDGLVFEQNAARNNNNQPSAGFGRMIWDGDNNLDSYSDRRLKKDIVAAEPVLERLMQVPVRRFHWTKQASDEPKAFGVVAQEVESQFPDIVRQVTGDEAGTDKVYTVKYGAFGLIASKAVQELKVEKDAERTALQQEIRDLKQEVAALKGRLVRTAQLERDLDDLRGMVRDLALASRNDPRTATAEAESKSSAALDAARAVTAAGSIAAR